MPINDSQRKTDPSNLKTREREMAELFIKQAENYADGRPSYPQELFQFIASKTPSHDLAWDVGTGNGQAARSLAEIYKNVIATDTSPKQLSLAPRQPNIRYQQTPPTMSIAELESNVAAESSVDVVTIAAAIHWLDLPNFYQQVKWVLKKPHGVIAAWAYFIPEINGSVDAVAQRFYNLLLKPYLHPAVKLAEDKYRSIYFPFEAVDGVDQNGPLFVSEKLMNLDDYFTFFRSWSGYQTAKEKGVELFSDDVIEEFKHAWAEDGQDQKVAKFPIYYRIGSVGNM